MKENIINQLNPNFKSYAVIAIQMTDFCNFSCKYCITGKKFSGKSIDSKSFEKIKKVILNLKDKYKNIEVTLTGGEPTLAKDFFYFINMLLDLEIRVKINTNAFILYSKNDSIEELSKNINKKNLGFNITFHYKEYIGKHDLFIETLKLLNDFDIDYGVNFLLPDNELIEKYIEVQNDIFSQVNLKSYNYSLIKSTNGKISENYSKQMLDYFDKNFNSEEKIKNLELIYENGDKEILSSSQVLYKGLNNFSSYKCIYLNPNYINIYIEPDLKCYFGICYTLNRINYTIDELLVLLDNIKEKSVICGDHSCLCESDFNTPKIKLFKKSNVLDRLYELIEKLLPKNYELNEIIIGNNSIQIIISKDEKNIFIMAEKIVDKSINYSFSDFNLGFHYFVKTKDNEFITLDKIDEKQIMLFMGKLYLYREVLNKIIDNTNKKGKNYI